MKIIYKNGSLLDGDEKIWLQSLNAQGVMASGIAKAIREKYPEVFSTYRSEYVLGGNHLDLGRVILVECSNHIVLNIIGQQFYGRDNRRYVSYDAIEKGLSTVNSLGFETIAMPMIGAGLGGGNFNIIATIIEETLTNVQPVVYRL